MPALLFSYFIVLYFYSCHIIWYDPIKSALTRIDGGIVLLQIRCSTINSTNQVKMKQLCITNIHWAILIQSLIHIPLDKNHVIIYFYSSSLLYNAIYYNWKTKEYHENDSIDVYLECALVRRFFSFPGLLRYQKTPNIQRACILNI